MKIKQSGLIKYLKNASFIDWFLPLLQILTYYTLPVISSVGQMIMLVYILIYVFLHKKISLQIPKYLLVFIIYGIPVQIITFSLNGGFNINRVINLIMVVVFTMTISMFQINKDFFYKAYFWIGLITSIAIIIQAIQVFIFGQNVQHIMILPMEPPEAWYSEGLRPVGFFPEPQVYATFVLPLLVHVLTERKYVWGVFFSVAIVASTSSLGVLCVLGIWAYVVIFSDLSVKRKVAIILMAVVVLGIIISTPLFTYAIEKVANTDYSNNARLTRGFYIWSELKPIEQFFGIGMNNLAYYLDTGKLVLTDRLSVLMRDPSYVTSVAQLLIYWGVIGTIIYFIFVGNLVKNSKNSLMILLFIALSFGQTILFSNVWIFYLMIIISSLREENDCFIKVNIRK